jgi:hypothetical protein
MSSSLWPNLSGITQTRGMREMLVDAAGDISAQTNGDIEFYVDLVGVGLSGLVKNIRYNCYLRAVKTGYLHLFFQVTTPSTGPWPACLATPEGESYAGLTDETKLRDAIMQVLQRTRTAEIVYYLRSMVR